jgi:hypothetical protein
MSKKQGGYSFAPMAIQSTGSYANTGIVNNPAMTFATTERTLRSCFCDSLVEIYNLRIAISILGHFAQYPQSSGKRLGYPQRGRRDLPMLTHLHPLWQFPRDAFCRISDPRRVAHHSDSGDGPDTDCRDWMCRRYCCWSTRDQYCTMLPQPFPAPRACDECRALLPAELDRPFRRRAARQSLA